MSTGRDPFKRHKTRHPGISYRLRADGSRAYNVYAQGRQHPVAGGEAEALTLQADLRSKQARGIRNKVSKLKFETLAQEWLNSKSKLRARTRTDYQADLDNVILPRLGHLKPTQITADTVAAFIRELEQSGLGGARIQNILKPLNGTLKLAQRRGIIATNPLELLTTDERPHAIQRDHHVWSPDELKHLLAAAAKLAQKRDAKQDYTLLLTVAVYTGLRISELLGLRWCDLILKTNSGALDVRHQLSRDGTLVEPKTATGRRHIPLANALVKQLNQHKLASNHSQDNDFVFASNTGTALNARNVVRRGFEPALKEAGLNTTTPKITFHDLRHAFASLMVAQGTNSIELATVMGHRDSRTTETIYIHLFDRERSEEKIRAAMQTALTL